MVAYKDEERGTWYVSFYYEDWTGAKKRKVKRGFRTKKEALNFEAERRKDCGSTKYGAIRKASLCKHQIAEERGAGRCVLKKYKLI